MRLHLCLLFPVVATTALAAVVHDLSTNERDHVLRRDGHHSHHGTVLSQLNESQILEGHGPTPPSYWSIEFDENSSGNKRYPGLMGLHVLFMCLAFFGALPVGK